MADERTPADLRREVLRARREREEAIRKELEAPDFGDHEEPSYRIVESLPTGRLTVEAETAEGAAKLLEASRRKQSSAPPSSRLGAVVGALFPGRRGKVIGAVVGALYAVYELVKLARGNGWG